MPPKKPTAKGTAKESAPAPATDLGASIKLGELANELMGDSASYKKSGRWPLVLDPSGNSVSFLRYQNANMIKAMNPADMSLDTIRMALLGGFRYGKPVILDLEGADLFDICVTKFDELQKGLMDSILSKEILTNEKYLSLVRDSDGPEYQANNFLAEAENFLFIITTKVAPPSSLRKRTFVLEVQ